MKLKQHRLVMTKLEVYTIRKMLKTMLILFGISWVLFLVQYIFWTWHAPPPIMDYLKPQAAPRLMTLILQLSFS